LNISQLCLFEKNEKWKRRMFTPQSSHPRDADLNNERQSRATATVNDSCSAEKEEAAAAGDTRCVLTPPTIYVFKQFFFIKREKLFTLM
jgi:hypothetical protein